ncbi:potassium-transporting ATPase subunit KdpA [uncultured Jatrophihabitans sp.]|uniref:potassium-transporting ATPase subunit KdpA n=1 Tax=uncultured Jatrophihabitans sp. TaxID=1610747 RepID=UPI0035CB4D1C
MLTAVVVVAVLIAVHVPLGDYIAHVYTSDRHWRVERVVYRVGGIDPESEQRWPTYLMSVLAFSAAGILGLYALLRLQSHLPFAEGHPGVPAALAFNTAVSFTTNTSWQAYAGESTMGHLALAVGLGTQAFLSAAVAMAAVVALIRGLTRRNTDRLGNFWVDVTRSCTRIVLPLALVGGVVLLILGVIQNWHGPLTITTLAGAHQTILGGPVASWEPIKLLTGDGGGAFNANSAHPFENPSPISNAVEIILMLLIPSAFPRAYGRMVKDRRQGWALAAVSLALLAMAMVAGIASDAGHHGTVPTSVGASVEGTETRNGVDSSALFGVAATSSADGAADASYDSFSALAGGVLLGNMMLAEVSPGGAGSGLYGLLVAAILAVFVGGLMVGRTPEFLGKRIRRREMTFVALYSLAFPATLLIAAAVAVALPAGRATLGNSGAHGLSEALYAVTSTTASNGSAFAGLNANTDFYNILLGIVMLIGRYLPLVFILALAGAFARQRRTVAATAGTLRTDTPMFVGLVLGVVVLVTLLSFLPALALGPLAEALH